MKKKIILLVIVLMISLSIVVVGNTIDDSMKKIPEKAILL